MKYKACERCARSVGMVNVYGNIAMILVKGYLGVVGGSKALVADAVHSSADLLATIVMIIGLRISSRRADGKYPYGYGKSEYIVAIAIYLFLFVIGIYILLDGILIIVRGHLVTPCFSAAWGAFLSITINELLFRQSLCAGTQIDSPSILAKAWETRSDVLSSIAVLVGILGSMLGFHFMDPLAAIVVGIIILKICIESIRESVYQLMDHAPEEELVDGIHEALAKVPNIVGIRKVMAREMGQSMEVEVRLDVSATITVSQGEEIKKAATRAVAGAIKRQSIVRVNLLPAAG
ncbi:MAG: cation transporter [Deltaproteobacteria bacterium]|nr:cation transporter [Deltaproteobacteria bacterium]